MLQAQNLFLQFMRCIFETVQTAMTAADLYFWWTLSLWRIHVMLIEIITLRFAIEYGNTSYTGRWTRPFYMKSLPLLFSFLCLSHPCPASGVYVSHIPVRFGSIGWSQLCMPVTVQATGIRTFPRNFVFSSIFRLGDLCIAILVFSSVAHNLLDMGHWRYWQNLSCSTELTVTYWHSPAWTSISHYLHAFANFCKVLIVRVRVSFAISLLKRVADYWRPVNTFINIIQKQPRASIEELITWTPSS